MTNNCAECGHSRSDHRDGFCRFLVFRYERCHCTALPATPELHYSAGRIDRLIWWAITPWCHLENTARRIGHWIAEHAIDRYVTRFANVTADPEEDEQ